MSEWYFGKIDRLDSKQIYKQWKSIVEEAKIKKRNGVRVFADVRGFFDSSKHGELLDYEKTLLVSFDFPLSAVCAYTDKLIERIDRREFQGLRNHHEKIIYKLGCDSSKSSNVPGVMRNIIWDAVNDAYKWMCCCY